MSTPEEVLAEARSCMVAGDLEGAAQIFKQACKRWNREPEFRIRYADVLARLGRHSQAFRQYKRVMRLSPERLDACAGAAECALASGWARDATRLYGRAIGLGLEIDLATTGIARALCLRKRHHEAWERANTVFLEGGNKSRVLHGFMTEIAPIVGLRVPPLDEFDLADLPDEPDRIRRDHGLHPESVEATFTAGSIEAMAGIDEQALLTPTATAGMSELLGESPTEVSATPLGIDLSALSEPSPASASEDSASAGAAATPADQTTAAAQPSVAEETGESASAGRSSEEEDDPFADFPDLD